MNQLTVKERLYNLLPAVYRQQDFLLGEPLRALLAIVEGELGILETDIYNLYENWFVETCEEWVMPYIAELVGISDLNDPEKIFPIQRSRIGNTIRYRRHKGTPRTLELVIEDTTGWTARVVEMFEYVITTQYLQRPRTHRPATFTLTQSTEMVAMRDYFDGNAHTLDIRAFDVNRIRYNLQSLGIFIWRLQSYPVKRSTPCYRPLVSNRNCKPVAMSAGCYTFHPLGYDMPLFNRPQRENIWKHNLREIPMAISQEAFQKDIQQPPELSLNSPYYYGPDRSLLIYLRNLNEFLPEPPAKIEAKSLIDWQAPSPGNIAVDVELGRFMFAPGEDPGWDNLQVNFSYGFSGNMGGGPYNRRETLANYTDNIWFVAKNGDGNNNSDGWYTDLLEAIAAWQESGKAHGIIRIMDNSAYFNSGDQMAIVPLEIEMKGGDRLTIEAGNGYNPSISPLGGDLIAIGNWQEEATLRLNGLLCGGKIVIQGNINLELDHCTIREADQSIVGVGKNSDNMKVSIANSIVGNLELPADSKELVVSDSIVDGGQGYAIASNEGSYGPPTKIERTTVLGGVYSKKMFLGSETIFTKPVMVQEREGGGLRYSYAPVNSQTPERYECQPEKSGKPELKPSFISLEYGQPGYTQLSLTCPKEIENGAGNGAEMGVFNNLKRPQRAANLEASLEEYVRYGLEVNKVYKN